MKKNPTQLWVIVFALGWLVDFLFWKKAPGINFALFVWMSIIAAFYLLNKNGHHPRPTSLLLILPIGFFSAVTFIRAEPMTTFLAVVFTLLSMSLLTVTYLGGRWYLYTLGDYIGKAFQLAGSVIARPIEFMSNTRKEQKEAGVQTARYNIMPVVRGLIIALPIVAIFASLLASADVVFGKQLNNLIEAFNLENLPEYIFRLIYISMIGYALAGVFLHAATQSNDETLAIENKPTLGAFLGFTESSIVLASVVILFAAFVVVQFQYFFGGHANINVEGYTYSEYARKGFGELVTVAFFSLLMLLTLNAVTKRETETQRSAYSALGIALVALLMVMLFSAFKRLGLYEAAYGFSRLRTYTHVFLVWIGLLLITTILLEVTRKERMFTFAMLIASVGFAASLAILNVDSFIVEKNIQRGDTKVESTASGRYSTEVDTQYFLDLSDDAIPTLVNAYQSSTTSESLRERIGISLVCLQHQRETTRDYPWQSFHISRINADRALKEISKDLEIFQYNSESYPYFVLTPSGEEFPCSTYYMD